MAITLAISIHAPRVGSDLTARPLLVPVNKFQSTLPVWGATAPRNYHREGGGFQSTLPVWGATTSSSATAACLRISIHAPRVGSDGVGNDKQAPP